MKPLSHRMILMKLLFLVFLSSALSQEVIRGNWNMQASGFRKQTGKRFTIEFPGGGILSDRLWGSDLYTDDSSIGTAAIHAGLITPQNGGTVIIEIKPGADSYRGSERNGVTSKDWGPFPGSFIFVEKGVMAAPAEQPGQFIEGSWSMTASEYRGRNGKRFTISFPAWGTLSDRIYGSDLYTDDSPVGTAAVHAGLITQVNGGTVTIEIRPGAESYRGSNRNGITSKDWGPFPGSYIFTDDSTAKVLADQTGRIIRGTWDMRVDGFRGQNGMRYTILLPPGGTLSEYLWGSDVYTDHSYLGTAAVHAGLINPRKGGTVTIEIQPGTESYRGSLRNGVYSRDYDAFPGSFVFIAENTKMETKGQSPDIIMGTWTMHAGSFRRHTGKQFTITFPPGGTLSDRLWGSDLYTDDSSIGTAAIHAGLITPQNGGTVTIEIRLGASAYQGSTRNGVTSKDWGSFPGSFIFVKK